MSGKIFLTVLSLLLLPLVIQGCKKPRQHEQNKFPASTSQTYQGTIIAAGDSLTAGYGVAEEKAYPARLETKLIQNGYDFRVINAGISGETSSGLLSRISWLLASDPDIVILETGANDGLRGIPVDVAKQNITQAVRKLKENNVVVVLAGMRMVRNLGASYISSFDEMYQDIAADQDVILIPFFLDKVAGDPALNQADTIHPTAEGYERVVDTVYPYVVQAIKLLRN